MAKRLYFIAKPSYQGLIVEKTINFEYFRGQDPKQTEKSIESMQHAIKAYESGGKVLEVSKYSPSLLGKQLSSLNLEYENNEGRSYPVINIFESSKVFENGGPYRDLLHVDLKDLDEDPRLKESGRLLGFHFEDEPYSLEPRSLFFDYIYISALHQQKEIQEKLLEFDMISDVTYQMGKMFASSARACAYFISLKRTNKLESALESLDSFKKIYKYSF
jgi:hypothetical protein